ncbi:MAG TPA: zinc ABC transporter substrate-binding protein [Ktedonobacterales bacterium]|nr:zinc ABC transporter substrate-binding protein [Ktedonobacterales bacterium]
MPRRHPSVLAPLLALALAALLVGCGITSVPGTGAGVRVVAAENFWGSIAAQVGGSHVYVTNLIANADTDPHTYEPTTQDARAVADARYVIVNGAGYDPWADRLLGANPASGRKVLNVGDLSGSHAGDNPHLWYNPDNVTAVVARVRDDLKALDPAHAADYDQSAQTFLTVGLGKYHTLITTIKTAYHGTPVGATESIFAEMAPALGLSLITPYSYLRAVSEGTDIAAADEATVERQITQRQIKVLVYNSQNTPNNIQAILKLAQAQRIPVVAITETLPPGMATFQDWQADQLIVLNQALEQAARGTPGTP